MTLNEFKAWLDGFSSGFNGKAPNTNQWIEVLEKIKSIEEYCYTRTVPMPMPYPVWPHTVPNYPYHPNYTPIIYTTTATT